MIDRDILYLPEKREVLFEKYSSSIAMEEIFISIINGSEIINDVSQFKRYSEKTNYKREEYIFYIKNNKVLFYHKKEMEEFDDDVHVDFYSMLCWMIKDFELNRYEAIDFIREMFVKYFGINFGFVSTSVYLRTDILERDLLDRTIYES